MRRFIRSVYVLPTVVMLIAATSVSARADSMTLEQLQSKFPNTKFDWVKPSPIAGLSEVKMGNNFAYVDGSGRYFLFGHLFDMDTRVDLTQASIDAAAPKMSWTELPKSDAIVYGSDTAKWRVAVFSDPDCPFCRRIEPELQKLEAKGVQVWVFPYPIAQLHPNASQVSKQIWCSADKHKAWRDYVINRKPVTASGDCKEAVAVDRNVALAERFSIVATPTLIAGDGRMNSGADTADKLYAWITKPTANNKP